MPEINVGSTAGMITFIEKAPWEDKSLFIGDTYYPTYMVKDGVEYFVMNRAKSESGQGVYPVPSAQLESAKATLIANGGRHFKLHGFYDDPADMLREIMLERGCTFTEPEDIFIVCDSPFYGGGFTDFHGNWNEVSGAFHYRIYDKALLDTCRGSGLTTAGTALEEVLALGWKIDRAHFEGSVVMQLLCPECGKKVRHVG